MNDAWHYQIKAAQRDLITMAGGIERVATITEYSKSVVGRWNNPSDPEHMPMTAVRMLEKETDQPLITSIMAHETGRKVSEPNGPVAEAAAFRRGSLKLMNDMAEALTTIASAIEDDHVTPAEGTVIDRPLARIEDTVRNLRRLVGSVKAEGGVDLRVVEG